MKDYSVAFTNTVGGVFPNTLGINASGPSATDGTEFVKLMIDDIWGARQDLMVEAGRTPSGNDEAVGSSDFVAALKDLFWADLNMITGLVTSNNVTDSDHDIDVATGNCFDSTNAYLMKLTSGLIKQIDASWAVGTNAGGLFTGAVAIDTWYHVFLIRKDSDGTIDAGFDTSPVAANIPGGYTAFRRLGSVLTDGSSNILPFIQNGNRFMLDTPIEDYSAALPTVSRSTIALSTPLGVKTRAIVFNQLQSGASSTRYMRVSDLAGTDIVAGTTSHTALSVHDSAALFAGNFAEVVTDTSSQVGVRGNIAVTANVITHGWVDSRGKL